MSPNLPPVTFFASSKTVCYLATKEEPQTIYMRHNQLNQDMSSPESTYGFTIFMYCGYLAHITLLINSSANILSYT